MKRQRTKKRARQKYWKRTQSGSFWNWHDFAYAGRDTVNQLGKIAPDVIKNASLEINNIALKRINGIITLGGKKLKGCPQIFLGEPWGSLSNTLVVAGKICQTTALKIKKQDTVLNILFCP